MYWIALYDLLEARGFRVLLVDPRQIQRAPGRPKSDTQDAQWIRRLHSLGLLSGAFRPDEGIRVLRSYLRQRAGLVTECGRTIQHMQKALEQINVKLTEAVSDITGKTGLSIIQAILAGERDPTRLAQLRDRRCQQDAEQIARALQGTWREEHLFEVEAGGRALGVLPPTNQRLRRADPDAPPDAAGSKRRRAAGGQDTPAETQGQRPAFRCAAGGVPGDEG